MDVVEAIRARRTVKAFEPEPVERPLLEELLELARWAPNHNLTNPWRFRVLGPRSLEALKRAAGELAVSEAPAGADVDQVARVTAAKLDRAPTLIACSVKPSGDEVQAAEDRDATACAAYIVLLAAHSHGLAGYWRTPAVLRTAAGRAAIRLPDDERFVGLLHLGRTRSRADPPERKSPAGYVTFLD